MKAQRVRITEPGWTGYTDHFCGVAFRDGLSVDPVAPSIATQMGTILRVELVDDGVQGGMGNILVTTHEDEAEVRAPLEGADAVEASTPAIPDPTVYTREELEALADTRGIAGLREVADGYGVKGRGIAELIDEVLKAQAAR